MRTRLLLIALAASLTFTASASAQAPNVAVQAKSGQTVGQVIYTGFTYTVTADQQVQWTSKLTMNRKGRTVTLTKGLRSEVNYGQSSSPVEYTIPAAEGNGLTVLRSLLKKGAAVKLTLTMTGPDGSKSTISTTTRLARG